MFFTAVRILLTFYTFLPCKDMSYESLFIVIIKFNFEGVHQLL